MKKSYILIILISFLVLSPKLYAQVECPCDFEAVPKTLGCWASKQFENDPDYEDESGEGNGCTVRNIDKNNRQLRIGIEGVGQAQKSCFTQNEVDIPGCGPDPPLKVEVLNLTPEELKACQCELLAYTTALNEVEGISVSGGPPYECLDVDCRQKVLTPIPTLNEYGMIITAAVLGLLAVIGLFVIRRRKVTA